MNDDLIYDAVSIFHKSILAANPYSVFINSIQRNKNTLEIIDITGHKTIYTLSDFRRIIVVGAGKATAYMAKALEDRIGDRLVHGRIIVKYGHSLSLMHIECFEGGHPIPDTNSIKGTSAIVELLSECDENDLVFCLISGGASSLLTYPRNNISLSDIQHMTKLLLSCGASIQEINSVRRTLSLVKGGGLAAIAYPAKVVSLFISDVIGDPLLDIGSGPTVKCRKSVDEAAEILEKYNLFKRIKKSVKEMIQSVVTLNESYDDEIFKNVDNLLICNNLTALSAAKKISEELGYKTSVLSSELKGDATEIVKYLIDKMKTSIKENKSICLLTGGESTVRVKGNGLGGRNQELALSFLNDVLDVPQCLFLSCGTDGSDGPTDAAGAIVTYKMINLGGKHQRIMENHLRNNDSYHYFENFGGHVKTGPTMTNVMDMQILLIKQIH